jgi:hypothetical protein
VEDAVDPVPDADVAFAWLEVDVGGPVGHRLGDEQIDQPDDGSFLDCRLDLRQVCRLLTGLAGRFGRDILHGLVELPVSADCLIHIRCRGNHRFHLFPGDRSDVVEGEDVRRIRHRHHEHGVLVADRYCPIAASHLLGDERGCARIDLVFSEVDEAETDLLGQRRDEIGFANESEVNEDPAEGTTHTLLLGNGRPELVLSDQALIEQYLAELLGLLQRPELPSHLGRWPARSGVPLGLVEELSELSGKGHRVDLRIFRALL